MKRILIIDDDESDHKLIREVLKNAGPEFEIQSAYSGEEGIEQAQNLKPDIILVDTVLPKMDGFETAQKLSGLPDVKSRLIIMTGKTDSIDIDRAVLMGVDNYCIKLADSLRETILQYV